MPIVETKDHPTRRFVVTAYPNGAIEVDEVTAFWGSLLPAYGEGMAGPNGDAARIYQGTDTDAALRALKTRASESASAE